MSFLGDGAEGRFMFERREAGRGRPANSFSAEPRGIQPHERLFGFREAYREEEDVDRDVEKKLRYNSTAATAAAAAAKKPASAGGLDKKDTRK